MNPEQRSNEIRAMRQAARETRFARAAINYLGDIPHELRSYRVEPLHYVEELTVVLTPKRESGGDVVGVDGRLQLRFMSCEFVESASGLWLSNTCRERDLEGASYRCLLAAPIYGGDDPFVSGGDR